MKNRIVTLCLVLVLSLMMLVPVIGESIYMDPKEAKVDWRQFEGTTIRALMCEHFASNAIFEYIDEFEELTGIKVVCEFLPESDYFNKLNIENASGGNPPEVYMENFGQIGQHAMAGWLSDLYQYVNDEKLTDPDFYRFDDFMASAIDYADYEGILPGIPITGEWQVLFYRKDLLEAAGLSVPTTMDELYDVATKLNDPKNNVSGFITRFKKNTGTWTMYGSYLSAFGDTKTPYVDPVVRIPQLNQPWAIDAVEWYIKLIQDAGPQGIVNYGWPECIAEMQAGNAAIMADASGFLGQLVNPELCPEEVSKNISFAPIPVYGNHERRTHVNHWMLGISNKSTNPEAGWLFVEWATSPQMTKKMAMITANCARNSIWDDPDFLAAYDYEGYAEAVKESALHVVVDINPQIPEVQEFSNIVEEALHEIYGGADATTVLNDAQAQAEALLERGI